MSDIDDGDYDRERHALFQVGLLPRNKVEARAVMALMAELYPIVERSRDERGEESEAD
jgi:hypothetical protein